MPDPQKRGKETYKNKRKGGFFHGGGVQSKEVANKRRRGERWEIETAFQARPKGAGTNRRGKASARLEASGEAPENASDRSIRKEQKRWAGK